MSIYMKIPAIKGNVSTRGYEGAIALSSIQQGGYRKIAQISGHSAQRDLSHLKMQHMRIVKQQDAASSALFQYLCDAKNIPSLDIYHMIFVNESPQWRAKITLDNVLIAHHEEVFSSEGNIEILDLAFTKIQKGYKQQNTNGQFQAASVSGYNLETAVAM
jgi:type VI protein secretion system component Hcp